MNNNETSPRDDCYNYPHYWDFSFRSETDFEADFIEAVCEKYVLSGGKRLLEPGCGGGRLVIELSSRGFDLTAFDLNVPSIEYLRERLEQSKLEAALSTADMIDFDFPEPFDLAFCTFNTFRHLTSEEDALKHLRSVARNLKTGGVYVLGFHLIPMDADEDDEESWTEQEGELCVTNTLDVIAFDREKRIETLQFTLEIEDGNQPKETIVSQYDYRLYLDTQFRETLQQLSEFELVEVFDFNYDIDEPVPFDDELSDAVFILRKR